LRIAALNDRSLGAEINCEATQLTFLFFFVIPELSFCASVHRQVLGLMNTTASILCTCCFHVSVPHTRCCVSRGFLKSSVFAVDPCFMRCDDNRRHQSINNNSSYLHNGATNPVESIYPKARWLQEEETCSAVQSAYLRVFRNTIRNYKPRT